MYKRQAGEQQYVGIQQVNANVLNMDQITQQNAALVEQSSAACQGLSEQAQKLTELVSFFKISEGHRVSAVPSVSSVAAATKPVITEPFTNKFVATEPLASTERNFETQSVEPAPAEPAPAAPSSNDDAELSGDWEEF